jgi:hypothetical protein
MFKIEPFKREHIRPLLEQSINSYAKMDFENGMIEYAEKNQSFTGKVNGEVMVCGGVIPLWPGRGVLWSVFSEESARFPLTTFNGVKKFVNDQLQRYRRIEVAARCDFLTGRRRIELLGFTLECERMVGYSPDGADCALYALVRGGT